MQPMALHGLHLVLVFGATELKISKIDHVSINVTDIKKSLDFYSRVLGLKQQQTVDCGDFDITYFALPDGSRLELFDYHGKNRNNPHEDEHQFGLVKVTHFGQVLEQL